MECQDVKNNIDEDDKKHHKKIYDLNVDSSNNDRATELKFCSLKRPHMRAFYVAIATMFIGMMLWISVAPLQTEIEETTDVGPNGITTAATFSVLGSMITRLLVGTACDTWGARRPMAAALLIASIATGLTTLVNTGVGLSIARFFSGAGGGTLIIAQFWSSSMFAKNIIGTASGLILGLGYTGSGFIQVLLGSVLFPLFSRTMSQEKAWKICLIFPAVAGVFAAIMALFLVDDTPHGMYQKVATTTQQLTKKDEDDNNNGTDKINQQAKEITATIKLPKQDEENNNGTDNKSNQQAEAISVWSRIVPKTLKKAATNRDTWILAFQYGMSSGTNTALLNIGNLYFTQDIGVSSSQASAVTSVVGWLGVTCFIGGLLSDKAMGRWGIRGRCLVQLANLVTESILFFIFPYTKTFGLSAFFFISCSMMATWATGSTFALLPYVDRSASGAVSGIVGFAGSLGAILLIQLSSLENYVGEKIMAGLMILSALLAPALRLQEAKKDTATSSPSDINNGDIEEVNKTATNVETMKDDTDSFPPAVSNGDIEDGDNNQ